MKAIKYLSCILLIAFSSKIYSQIPDTIWTKTFGGSLTDVGNSVKQTNDGGFIVAATTSSFGTGGQDIYLIKTDENGDTLWTKTFGGIGDDRAANIQLANDNGYAIFGMTNSFGNGGDDFLFWKTDSLGNTQWYKTYGGAVNERAYEGQQTLDSGYVIVGDSLGSNSKAWMIKTDKAGNFIWGRTIGNHFANNYFTGRSVQQLNNGQYVMVGTHAYQVYPGSYAVEYSLSRISLTGDSLSYRYYGMYGNARCPSVRELPDGYLFIGGCYSIGGNNLHPWILKTSYSGNIIWEQSIVGSQIPVELTALELTFDGGFIMTVGSFGGSAVQDFQLLKCNENGILSWEKIIGGPSDDKAYSVWQTSEGCYIVTGYTKSFGAGDSDVWLLKLEYNSPPEITVTSPNGGEYWLIGDTVDIKWSSISVDSVKIQLSLSEGIDWMTITESTPSDSTYEWVVQAPYTSWSCLMKVSDASDSTIYDISDTTFVIDMFPSVDDSTKSFLPTEFALFQNYPNPFNPVTSIQYVVGSMQFVSLKVYDILGNEVATLVNEEKPAGTYEVEFNTSSIIHHPSSGIYFYQLKSGSFVETKKMILLK